MPSGHCASAAGIEDGTANSTTEAAKFHANCPGVFHSSPIGPTYCDCECHAGQEFKPRTAPVVEALAAGKQGRKGRGGMIEQIGKELKTKGSITIDAPTDPTALTALRQRLSYAARKQALKVKVTVADGKITATVK